MPDRRPSLMRSLGAFVHHVWSGVTADVRPERVEVSRTTQERSGVDPDGRAVTLRRTTVDEIIVSPGPSAGRGKEGGA